MKQRKECLGTQNNRLSTVIRRYFNAGFSTLLQAGAVMLLILILTLSFLGVCNLGFIVSTASAVSAEITVTTSGPQNIDVKPDASGATATSIGVDNVNITSTCRSGYNLTIFTSINDN
ncbi:hypothetical protein IKD67_00865, partial [Candidatus Saccharibacteria bacterium]|nr:hypothetical protein [Candidatus Saccharibacteria bacterium]